MLDHDALDRQRLGHGTMRIDDDIDTPPAPGEVARRHRSGFDRQRWPRRETADRDCPQIVVLYDTRPFARLNRQAGPVEVWDTASEPFEACAQLPILDKLREVFFGWRDIDDIEKIARIELPVIRLARGDRVWSNNREIIVPRVCLPRRTRIAVVPPEAPEAGIEDEENAAGNFDFAEEDWHRIPRNLHPSGIWAMVSPWLENETRS
jgi:hypothetical protein